VHVRRTKQTQWRPLRRPARGSMRLRVEEARKHTGRVYVDILDRDRPCFPSSASAFLDATPASPCAALTRSPRPCCLNDDLLKTRRDEAVGPRDEGDIAARTHPVIVDGRCRHTKLPVIYTTMTSRWRMDFAEGGEGGRKRDLPNPLGYNTSAELVRARLFAPPPMPVRLALQAQRLRGGGPRKLAPARLVTPAGSRVE